MLTYKQYLNESILSKIKQFITGKPKPPVVTVSDYPKKFDEDSLLAWFEENITSYKNKKYDPSELVNPFASGSYMYLRVYVGSSSDETMKNLNSAWKKLRQKYPELWKASEAEQKSREGFHVSVSKVGPSSDYFVDKKVR